MSTLVRPSAALAAALALSATFFACTSEDATSGDGAGGDGGASSTPTADGSPSTDDAAAPDDAAAQTDGSTADGATSDDGGKACCKPRAEFLAQYVDSGADASAIDTACAQYDSPQYPPGVGKDLCVTLGPGEKWCEWTCP